MKIDLSKLSNVVRKPDGKIVAQCPACHAAGHDATGDHLIVFADGSFGCVVYPKDKGHNRQILELVGVDQPGDFTPRKVTVKAFKCSPSKTLVKVPRRTLNELGMKLQQMEVKM